MTRTNPRFVAIETLLQLRRKNTPLPVLFEQISSRYKMEHGDRSLAMNLVYGVLRNSQFLEILMKKLCRQPLKKLHPYVYQALAVGLYQIFFLSRIPDSAAVNETVNAVKTAKVPKRLHGFVNGVLRQSIRSKDELPQTDALEVDGVSILNHPDWLTSRWAARFGKAEMEAICRCNNQRQVLTLRLNSDKINRNDYLALLAAQDITAQPGRYAADAVLLPDYPGSVTALPGFKEGFFHVQGEAAQLASLLLQPFKPGCRVLDGCAGLGGKTTHLSQLLASYDGSLTAIEPEHHRQERLLENMSLLSPLKDFTLYKGSLQEFTRSEPPPFDAILIDAPCSGTGVIGRQPDIRWRRGAADIHHYAEIQTELINLAASMLLPGGVLVYATCSLEPEENIDIVSEFLQNNTVFTLTDCTPFLPDEAATLVREGCLQPRPTQYIDGFFGARLVRNIADD